MFLGKSKAKFLPACMKLLPNSENPFNNPVQRDFDQKATYILQMFSASKKRRTLPEGEIYEKGFSKDFQNFIKNSTKT
jgi:hypothetical protein